MNVIRGDYPEEVDGVARHDTDCVSRDLLRLLRHSARKVHDAVGLMASKGGARAPRRTTMLDNPFACAVKTRALSVGDRPTRQLPLRPVAIGVVVEVTKRSELSM